MTAHAQVRVHEDGSIAVRTDDPSTPWAIVAAGGGLIYARDRSAQGPGWSEAAVVPLPEVAVVRVVCGCGIAPEGAPWAAGCSAECGAPEEIQAHHPGGYHATGYVQNGEISANGAWYTPDGAERQATAMLGVARWLLAQAAPGGEQ